MIVNRTFLEMYPFYHIGSVFSGHTDKSTIIGSIRDFNFKPLQHSIGPFCLYNFGSTPWWQLSTGLRQDNPRRHTIYIRFYRKTINEVDPSISPEDI